MVKVAYLSLHIDTKRKNVLWKENVKNIHFNLGLVNFFESESFEKDLKKRLSNFLLRGVSPCANILRRILIFGLEMHPLGERGCGTFHIYTVCKFW